MVFFYAQKPLKIRLFSYFATQIDPAAEVFYSVFLLYWVLYAAVAATIVKLMGIR